MSAQPDQHAGPREARHDLAGEGAQARQHFAWGIISSALRRKLTPSTPIDSHAGSRHDPLRVADRDALGEPAGRPGCRRRAARAPDCRASDRRASGRPRASTADARSTARRAQHAHPGAAAWSGSSWQKRKFSVATRSLTAPTGSQTGSACCIRRAPLLLGEARRGDAEAADAARGGVELGAGAGHRHPHRRMRLLQGLGQHRPLGHREAGAL